MKVRVNEQGYITDYALIGDLPDSVEVPTPTKADLAHFKEHYRAYTLNGFDAAQSAAVDLQEQQEAYRRQRETSCFPIINRGILWYDQLTADQKSELETWYKNWLDVTETLQIPARPAWLK